MVNDLTTNADCSPSSSFQIEHHESNNTTSAIMSDESVKKRMILHRKISDEDFKIKFIENQIIFCSRTVWSVTRITITNISS